MENMFKTVAVLCVIAIFADVEAYKCNGGTQCIQVSQCEGLYKQLQSGVTPELTQLLRSLHCGFDSNDEPKICCPPEFLHSRTGSTGGGSTNTGTGGSNANANSDLLPDTRQCGSAMSSDRIVGGFVTDIDEHPWTTLLRYDKPRGWGFYCGGVLISSRYVMTAAHCVKGSDLPTDWRLSQVRLGEWNISSEVDCVQGDCAGPVVDVDIEEIIPHENYVPTDRHQHNDIALLRLSRNVQFNDFIQPICLPVSSDLRRNTFVDYSMDVAGWGKTENRSESDVKLKVSVPVVSNSQCSGVYQRVGRQISENQLCAGGRPGRDSCRGDSGGALMGRVSNANWIAVGIVSYGPTPCGTAGWPGVYTRVGAYMDWIISKLRA